MTTTRRLLSITVLSVAAITGCKARPSLVPNSDPTLRKTNEQFAADAKKRHPYPADATKGGEAVARAQVGYDFNKIELANFSNEDWKDVDVWVNGAYVVHLPRVEKGRLKTINFAMLYDAKGKAFPTNRTLVKKVEVLRDGTMYDVRVQLAE
jgi:hypothetical protein